MGTGRAQAQPISFSALPTQFAETVQAQLKYPNLIQNSQAVKKECGPQKGYGEKRCEIQGGSQEMAVMIG